MKRDKEIDLCTFGIRGKGSIIADPHVLDTHLPGTAIKMTLRAQTRPAKIWGLSKLMRKLREELKNPSARFTCFVQARAVSEVASRRSDILVVMGTGKGKSLVYQLPVLLETEKKLVTIVVVPLISLIEDAMKEGSAPGIEVGTWEERESVIVQLPFITPERATTGEFYTRC